MLVYVVEDGPPSSPATAYFGKSVPENKVAVVRRRVIMNRQGPHVISALAEHTEGSQELDDLIDAAFALGCAYERKKAKRKKKK